MDTTKAVLLLAVGGVVGYLLADWLHGGCGCKKTATAGLDSGGGGGSGNTVATLGGFSTAGASISGASSSGTSTVCPYGSGGSSTPPPPSSPSLPSYNTLAPRY